jgi:hypothetical protein
MRSDRVMLSGELSKLQCRLCGLVRGGGAPDEDLGRYYADSYEAAPDHTFFTPDGTVTRSAVVVDWVLEFSSDLLRSPSLLVEVGCGGGHLLRELARRLPGVICQGVEPGRRAATAAVNAGFTVYERLDDMGEAKADAMIAIAVLEHVASPSAFLRAMRARIVDGGLLILAQPTQDVRSYDVLFADHLHHFGTAHLAHYARQCGFRERRKAVGHPLMPNFSLHVWEAATSSLEPWTGPPIVTHCADAARETMADMARLDALLERLRTDARKVAAFGVHEVFAVARAYSNLPSFPLVCGLDDMPERRDQCGLRVVRPEEAPALGVTDALLTMNRVHYPIATRRLEALGISAHPVLSR